MSVMLITFDYQEMKRPANGVPGFIKGYNHIRISRNTYVIESFETTRTIFNKIKPLLVANAYILVVTLMRPFSGPVPSPRNEWFLKYLPEE